MTNRRGSAPELQAWAALVAAFYERNGRDPTESEIDPLVASARQMATAGALVLH